MKNYASAKGMPRHFDRIKVERPHKHREYKGKNKRIQLVHVGSEDYVYSPKRTVYTFTGKNFTYPEVVRTRPVFRQIIHNERP